MEYKGQVLKEIQNSCIYDACTFYLDPEVKYMASLTKMDNCSIRGDVVHLAAGCLTNIKNCNFPNRLILYPCHDFNLRSVQSDIAQSAAIIDLRIVYRRMDISELTKIYTETYEDQIIRPFRTVSVKDEHDHTYGGKERRLLTVTFLINHDIEHVVDNNLSRSFPGVMVRRRTMSRTNKPGVMRVKYMLVYKKGEYPEWQIPKVFKES